MSEALRQIFDREMQPFGGRLPDKMDEEDEEFFAPYRQYMRDGLQQVRERSPTFLKNVYVDFVGHPSFNARAFIVGEHEFIGINSGVSFPLGLCVPKIRFYNNGGEGRRGQAAM